MATKLKTGDLDIILNEKGKYNGLGELETVESTAPEAVDVAA